MFIRTCIVTYVQSTLQWRVWLPFFKYCYLDVASSLPAVDVESRGACLMLVPAVLTITVFMVAVT